MLYSLQSRCSAWLCILAGFFAMTHARVANITMFYDNACKDPGQAIQPLLNFAGNCTSSLSSFNFVGIEATYLAPGCTLTFYSDEYCSDDPVLDPLKKCGSLSSSGGSARSVIASFSIDGCSSTVVSDWNSASASAVTSFIAPSPTGSSSNDNVGGKLAEGSEIGSILGPILGVFAIAISIVFGMNQWKKHKQNMTETAEEDQSLEPVPSSSTTKSMISSTQSQSGESEAAPPTETGHVSGANQQTPHV